MLVTPRYTAISQVGDEAILKWAQDFNAYKPRRPDGSLGKNYTGYFLRSDEGSLIGMANDGDREGTRRQWRTGLFASARLEVAGSALSAGRRDEARSIYEQVAAMEQAPDNARLCAPGIAAAARQVGRAQRDNQIGLIAWHTAPMQQQRCEAARPAAAKYALALLGAAMLASALFAAERSGPGQFGWWRGEPVLQNDPPATEFVAARWHFGTNGNVGHMGWAHNYPYSERNFNEFLARATGLDVQVTSYRIVELGSDEVFDYPFAYVSEPGEMLLTDQEVTNLREFIDRGGFVLMDDFDGSWQFEQMRSQIRRAFPLGELVPLTPQEHMFHINFELDDFAGMAHHVPGGTITYYGMRDEKGRLAVVAGHNNDLANFWEWYDQPSMPLKPAADAFRLGTNVVLYSMTH